MVISSYYNYKSYDPATSVVSVNNSSTVTLKKKANPKFSQISSKGVFTLNGTSNSQSYIGKSNYIVSKPPTSSNSQAYCRKVDNNPKTSVKSYSAYLKSKLYESPVNSLKCYKEVNKSIIDISLNKHINITSNNDYDMRIFNLKNNVEKCFSDTQNCSIYNDYKTGCSVNTQNNTSGIRSRYISNKCNIARSNKCVNGVVPDYNVYKSKKMFCLYNPSSQRVIAC